MGLGSYFKPKPAKAAEPAAPTSAPAAANVEAVSEKAQNPFDTPVLMSRNPSGTFNHSSSNSVALRGSGSHPASIFRGSDYSRSNADLSDLKCEVMVSYIHQQQAEKMWIDQGYDEGVVLKKSKNSYACAPANLADVEGGLMDAIEVLNVRVAMTVNTKVIKLFLASCTSHFVPLSNGLRLQVLPDISYVPRCSKGQYAAFIADRGILVVWDDNPRYVLKRAAKIEQELLQMLWKEETEEDEEKSGAVTTIYEVNAEDGDLDLEGAGGVEIEKRPIMLWQPIYSGFTMILTVGAIGLGWRQIAIEMTADPNWMRLAFIACVPLQIWVSLFFFHTLVISVLQVIGPIKHIRENSRYYSGKAPRRLNRDRHTLPHVTIQMPVYKEGLASVIEPTIRSIKAAIATYEMQGGSANIFVNDDGMQLIDEDLARARQDFYEEHNIGWTARPKHNPKPAEGEQVFLRRGKFKKASNMNYGMWVSARVEDRLAAIHRDEKWTLDHERAAYDEALAQTIAEDEGRTWAEGNIRIGDYILIIDSDTRVPEDCFLDAVSEMEQSPRVAIIQYSSGVMNVTTTFFERGITFFTNLIFTAIRFSVSNGDVSPFIGHNAVLKWSAVQEVAFDCKQDGYEKYWSEDTVSEDFDMALRLQNYGYHIRFGAYTGDGFKEGVSLTVYDELARWEKYAYGCSELIFHPFKDWIFKGPFTPIIRSFVVSNIPIYSKFSMVAYIGSYFAIGSAWFMTILNYFVIGWLNGYLDHYYIDSFKIFFATVVVFGALGNVALAVLRYRTQENNLIRSLLENLKWLPLMTVFFGGLSIHVSQAILCHLFSIDMQWGATSKEAENTTFFDEIPKVLKKFKFTFAFCILSAALMVVMAHFVPYNWQIQTFICIFPYCTLIVGHFLMPIALNPNLMLFKF